jgi:hypothetical protein
VSTAIPLLVVTSPPALTVEADATIAELDARNPEGADYVIVPAMSRDDDPAVLSWLRGQAKKGAIILEITERYGDRTAHVVAMQLEYPREAVAH